MAAKKEAPVAKATKDTITITLPRPTSPEEQNFRLVGVNGKFYKVMKGVPVEVPVPVAEVLFNAQDAEDEAFDFIQSLQK